MAKTDTMSDDATVTSMEVDDDGTTSPEPGIREAFTDESDEQVEKAIAQLRTKRLELSRESQTTVAEAHKLADLCIEKSRNRLKSYMHNWVDAMRRNGGSLPPTGLADFYVGTLPEVVAALHDTVDADVTLNPDRYSTREPADIVSELEQVRADITAREGELAVRYLNRKVAQAKSQREAFADAPS